MNKRLADYASEQYVRNVRLTFDQYDPDTDTWTRTQRDMRAEVTEILTPVMDEMGVPK